MDSPVRLAVDTMSGAHGVCASVPAALQALRADPRLHIQLIGAPDLLQRELDDVAPALLARLQLVAAATTLPAQATPLTALRGEQDSALHVALAMLARGESAAAVSAGSSAALMALGKRQPGLLAGFARPALCSAIPAAAGHSYMLDLGANVDCSAAHLHQFALMGLALIAAVTAVAQPRVALLSNGREASKGNAVIRQAAQLLADDPRINYIGFVEGGQLHSGSADLIVCDGLLGNVALKVAEGTAGLARQKLRASRPRGWRRLIGAGRLAQLERFLAPDRHGGAFLLGLQGVVVKSHGDAGSQGFYAALQQAVRCVDSDMIARMKAFLARQEQP